MKKLKIGEKNVVIVSPGEIFVSKDPSQMLAATLGSCVGLAMYDRINKIGGLIHVVFPRSLSKSEEIASLCAENAVDRLLDEMIKFGVKKDAIVAGICGGFNLGLSVLDDSAVESIKIIKNNLKEQKIPIQYLEPIEHLSKFFVLDINNGIFTCRDIFLDQITDGKKNGLNKNIEDLLSKVKPIPSIVMKVLDLISREEYEITEIVEQIKKDEVMTARLLKFSNSPVFSPLKKIDSLEKAVIFLGSRNLLNTILSVFMEDFFDDCIGYSLQSKGMYNHVLSVAIIAQKICDHIGLPKDVGYTCGLLHDIGKRVLEYNLCNNKRIYYKEIIKGRDSIDVEKELFGFDHCEIGYLIGRKWNFPENILNVIKNHHKVTIDMDSIVKVIYIANVIAYHLLPGFVIGAHSSGNFEEIMKSLNLTYTNLNTIMETFPFNTIANE